MCVLSSGAQLFTMLDATHLAAYLSLEFRGLAVQQRSEGWKKDKEEEEKRLTTNGT